MATAGESAVEEEDPLVAGVVRGVRKWEVGRDRHGNPRLLGYANWAWQPWGKPTIAACLAGKGPITGHVTEEPAPAGDCNCGLYAHHPWARRPMEDYDLLSGVSPEDDWLIGVVEAWGKLEVHEDGFRAQFARPILLVAGTPEAGRETETLDRVAAEYRCFAVRVASVGDLRTLFGEVSGALDPSFVEELTSSFPRRKYGAPYTPPAAGPRRRGPSYWLHEVYLAVSNGVEVLINVLAFLAKVVLWTAWGIFSVMFWLTVLGMVGIVVYGIGSALLN